MGLIDGLISPISSDVGIGGGSGTTDWASITSTPTTLVGYGITDAQPLDADLTAIAALTTTGVLRRTAVDTWSFLTVGTAANNLVQLDASARLPAVNGSLLTNISIPSNLLLNGGTATGLYNIAFGGITTGNNNIAIGGNSSATNESFAFGFQPTATGINSFAFGYYPLATGTHSFSFGSESIANSVHSFTVGRKAHSFSRQGLVAFGGFTNEVANGDSQQVLLKFTNRTTDLTPTSLTTDSDVFRGTANIYTLQNFQSCTAQVLVNAIQKGSDGSNSKSWVFNVRAYRGANAASATVTIISTVSDGTAGASAWSATIVADTTVGGWYVEATGATATNIQWTAGITAVETIYA